MPVSEINPAGRFTLYGLMNLPG